MYTLPKVFIQNVQAQLEHTALDQACSTCDPCTFLFVHESITVLLKAGLGHLGHIVLNL